MPNEFNIGVERSIQLTDSVGRIYTFNQLSTTGTNTMGGDLLSFEARREHAKIRITPASNGGVQKVKHARQGWSGSIRIARISGAMDALEAAQEQRWVNGIIALVFTIDEVTINTDIGTTDRFRYTNAALVMTSNGANDADRPLEVTLEFDGAQRLNLNNLTAI